MPRDATSELRREIDALTYADERKLVEELRAKGASVT